LAALEWAVARRAHLVNLSLGTANPENAEKLASAVTAAREQGTLVVSARADGNRSWFPGSLEGVGGVDVDWSRAREEAELECRGATLLAKASGYPRPIPGVPPARNLKGVSFAVANVTGLLARALDRRSTEDVVARTLGLARVSARPGRG